MTPTQKREEDCSTCGLKCASYEARIRMYETALGQSHLESTRYRIWFTVSLIGNVALVATSLYARFN